MYSKIIAIIFSLLFLSAYVKSQDKNYKPREIIVMLKYNADAASLENALASAELRVKQVLVKDINIWLYEFNANLVNDDIILNKVRMNPNVAAAQFNHYTKERSLLPNDPLFSQQWAMKNTGQDGGTIGDDIDAPSAWSITTGGITAAGDTIVIAVIDGGFYLDHPDINFWKNKKKFRGTELMMILMGT